MSAYDKRPFEEGMLMSERMLMSGIVRFLVLLLEYYHCLCYEWQGDERSLIALDEAKRNLRVMLSSLYFWV